MQIGSSGTTTKFDMQPVQPRVYDFMNTQSATKKETVLALPPSGPTQGLLAIKGTDSPVKTVQATAVIPDARDYNELMDEYSLHQLIIRRGHLLEQTPEFNSFKRTFLQKWG